MRRLFVVASYSESSNILKSYPNADHFIIKGYELWKLSEECFFSVLGIAKVTFAIGIQVMINYLSPDIVYSIGFAGAIGSKLNIFDEVLVTETYQYDVVSSRTIVGNNDNVELRRLNHYLTDQKMFHTISNSKEFAEIKPVVMLTGDNFLNNRDTIKVKNEWITVDQETSSLYQACHYNCIPCATFKIITDLCNNESYEMYEINLDEAGQHLFELYNKILRLKMKIE